jgi:hypothetical protein
VQSTKTAPTAAIALAAVALCHDCLADRIYQRGGQVLVGALEERRGRSQKDSNADIPGVRASEQEE